WLDGKELHFGTKHSKAATTGEMTPLGKELADTKWLLALWGHGTIYEAAKQFSAQMAQIPVPDLASTMIRVMTTMNEVGLGVRIDGGTVKFMIGVRTIWSNPDDVVAKVL